MASAEEGKAASTQSDDSNDIHSQENVSVRGGGGGGGGGSSSSSSGLVRATSKQPVRHRASVACASCRDRRIRCVVPKGETACTQCKRVGAECVIKNDDERRRPISKAYMSSLSDRIQLLESMLVDRGVVPPPAVHPPKTRQEAQAKGQSSTEATPQPAQPQRQQQQQQQLQQQTTAAPTALSSDNSPSRDDTSPSESAAGHADDVPMQDDNRGPTSVYEYAPVPPAQPFRSLDLHKESIVQRLLSTQGSLSFDPLSGRLRFFGPTANGHVYAATATDAAAVDDAREPPELVRRLERIVRSLTAATHDYLMDCFWTHYNTVIPVVDRGAFEAGRAHKNAQHYTSFLHLAVLAMRYRFADRRRADMQKLGLDPPHHRESTLQREAKYMLDMELERPGGLPSVQALLLLGDLECGVGRDRTGWMYAGMANRMAFDLGLHLDGRRGCGGLGRGAGAVLDDRDAALRRMVMRAAIVLDRHWALFLGRPTSIKSQDLGLDLLTKRVAGMASTPASAPAAAPAAARPAIRHEEIYEYLFELMELAGAVAETGGRPLGEASAYLDVIRLDRQLQNWYRRLPDHLAWQPANIQAAPMGFFLLHQQYHVSMILLHRPWARYGCCAGLSSSDGVRTTAAAAAAANTTDAHPSPDSDGSPGGAQSGGLASFSGTADDRRTALSRSICTQQAVRVARIFWQHRQRFDGRRISVTAVQHAGTAALALVGALACQQSTPSTPNTTTTTGTAAAAAAAAAVAADRRAYLGCLEILSAALADMGHTYQPAARMDDLLQAVREQLRCGPALSLQPPQQLQPSSSAGSASSRASTSTATSLATTLASGLGVYTVLPARRENPDAAAGDDDRPGWKKRRRPPPPFLAGDNNGSPYETPVLFFGEQQQQQQQQQQQPGAFTLDFLSGPAVDLDAAAVDDYVLVPPGSDGSSWALHGAGETGKGHADHRHHHDHSAYDLADWLGAGAAASAARLDHIPTPVSAEGAPDAVRPKQEEHGGGGNDWLEAEEPLGALSPVSLSGLVVQTVEKTVGEAAGGPLLAHHEGRNHDLDFFRF